MKGLENDGQAVVAVADSLVFRDEVNRTNIGAATAAVAAPIPAETENYT